MDYQPTLHQPIWVTSQIYRVLAAFPVACFSLTVATDLIYLQTSNLLWLHFSEWLLLAGLVFGVFAALYRIGLVLFFRGKPLWFAAVGGLVVLLLAALNSFIHTADGWTAVLPWGLTVSIATVVAMIATSFIGTWRRVDV